MFLMFIINPHKIPFAHTNLLNPNNTNRYAWFTAANSTTLKNNLYSNYSIDYISEEKIGFKDTFGVLFSGVTGIMAGANMSGELKNPGKAIPYGTLYACVCTFLTYCIILLVVAATVSHDVLVNNYLFMGYLWLPSSFTVYTGVALATLSASMANMIGASRVLRAIADDEIFGSRFLKIFSSDRKVACQKQYLAPLILTFLLVACVLFLKELNTIAQYSSVLFLLSYTMVNMSVLMLTWASAPNFRPTFHFYNWQICLFGAVTCLIMMIYLNMTPAFGCIAGFVVLVLVLYMNPATKQIDGWGSIGQAVLFHTVRKYLLKIDARKDHVKFWRPHLMLLVSNPRSACSLIDFLNDLKKSGIYVLGHVNPNNGAHDDLTDEYGHWQSLVDYLKVKASYSFSYI